MSQASVENIIRDIESLTAEDREALERRLDQIDEAKWLQEAAEARDVARKAGIDQAGIDKAIAKLRYP